MISSISASVATSGYLVELGILLDIPTFGEGLEGIGSEGSLFGEFGADQTDDGVDVVVPELPQSNVPGRRGGPKAGKSSVLDCARGAGVGNVGPVTWRLIADGCTFRGVAVGGNTGDNVAKFGD